jgi:hypothetical protein
LPTLPVGTIGLAVREVFKNQARHHDGGNAKKDEDGRHGGASSKPFVVHAASAGRAVTFGQWGHDRPLGCDLFHGFGHQSSAEQAFTELRCSLTRALPQPCTMGLLNTQLSKELP